MSEIALSQHLSDFDSLTESDLDAQRPRSLLFSQKAMLPIFVAIVARCAIGVGLAFILSRTVPSMPRNKVFRFALLFVLCVPLNFVINYFNVWTLGYHKMSWTGAFVIALLFALYGTLSPSQPHNPNTP
jgi:hypothetical protein